MLCSISISFEKRVNTEEHITLYSEASIGICDRLSLEVHKNTFYVFTPSLKCVTFVAISHPKSPLVASASIIYSVCFHWYVGGGGPGAAPEAGRGLEHPRAAAGDGHKIQPEVARIQVINI